jgi:hypothetical protein
MAKLLLVATEEFYAERERIVATFAPIYGYLDDAKALEKAQKRYVDIRQAKHWRLIEENEKVCNWAQKIPSKTTQS